MTIFASVVAVLAFLPYCYYASRITAKMYCMTDDIFESRWYEFPVELQKNLKIMIAFAQIRRTVNGYGLLNLDLEGFVKVLRNTNSFLKMFNIFVIFLLLDHQDFCFLFSNVQKSGPKKRDKNIVDLSRRNCFSDEIFIMRKLQTYYYEIKNAIF